MLRRLCLIGLAIGVFPAAAQAHAFESGADLYAQFLEGAGVILGYPETLLPLLSLGVLLSLWQPEGMLSGWPALLVGLLIGIPLSAFVGPWVIPAVLGAGIVAASLGALLPRHNRVEAWGLSFGLGLLVSLSSLEGHGLLELPLFIYLGIFFAANMVTAASAGLARLALEHVEAAWMRILWRIAASWLAAIMLLMLAFILKAA